MTEDEIMALARRALFEVAPDLEGESINPDESLRDQFEIDSMDLLNFFIKLHDGTGVDIPEKDYAQLATMSGVVAYLKSRLGAH
ncbi:MAG: phosphopantetheine-binding protein [Pseudomonadota bacterium]